MTQRYFVENLPKLGGIVPLSPHESQHAIRVMRLKLGDAIVLFDGLDHESTAIVTNMNRSECVCEAGPARHQSREPKTQLHLGIALPKGDRAKEMIERLTELGVKSVTPLISQRSQRPPSTALLEKLPRIVIEASKQCGRNTLLTLKPPVSTSDYFLQLSGCTETKWILDTASEQARNTAPHDRETIYAAIGPEGGWTDEELQLATEQDYQSICLGSRTLRIETAAAAIASFCCCVAPHHH